MRNFKITLEYDGTNYCGWQHQKDSNRLPTIQNSIEQALRRIFNKKISITGSGRTDAGVHAFAQVASFKVNTNIPIKNIFKAVNTYLPEDIIIKEIEEVPLSFNARFSAKKKWYRYTILNNKINSVFNRFHVIHIPYILNVKLMQKAANIIKGKHDFSAIVLESNNENKTRQIYKLSVSKKRNYIIIDIIGNGFLYKMARRIVGILIDIGRGKMTIDDVKKIINATKVSCEIQTAPAKGLSLLKVCY